MNKPTEYTKTVSHRGRKLAVLRYKETEIVEDEDYLKRVIEAWRATKGPIGYTTFTSIQGYTHLPYDIIFGVLKWLHKTNPYAVIFSVERMGKCVYFKLVPSEMDKKL